MLFCVEYLSVETGQFSFIDFYDYFNWYYIGLREELDVEGIPEEYAIHT